MEWHYNLGELLELYLSSIRLKNAKYISVISRWGWVVLAMFPKTSFDSSSDKKATKVIIQFQAFEDDKF